MYKYRFPDNRVVEAQPRPDVRTRRTIIVFVFTTMNSTRRTYTPNCRFRPIGSARERERRARYAPRRALTVAAVKAGAAGPLKLPVAGRPPNTPTPKAARAARTTTTETYDASSERATSRRRQQRSIVIPTEFLRFACVTVSVAEVHRLPSRRRRHRRST